MKKHDLTSSDWDWDLMHNLQPTGYYTKYNPSIFFFIGLFYFISFDFILEEATD